jgi:ABC-type Fe3+ transport system permease subunit
MKRILIAINILATIALIYLGGMALSAHRTQAYSVYRELQMQHVLSERPDYDIRQRLRTIADGGIYSLWLAYLGAGVCMVNAVLIGWSLKNARPPAAAGTD